MFEIGDKVIVKTVDELCDVYDVKYINTPYLAFIEEMYQYAGKEAVITEKIIIEEIGGKFETKYSVKQVINLVNELKKMYMED